MWLCEVCRSSARLLHIPSLVDKDVEDLTTDHGASSSEISSDRSKKHKPPYLAFPSPKRKPRTPRVPGKICFNFSFCRKMRLCFCVFNWYGCFFSQLILRKLMILVSFVGSTDTPLTECTCDSFGLKLLIPAM